MGLWRSIYIQAYSDAVVRDITIVTRPHAADQKLARLQALGRPDPADKFEPADQSEAATIARTFKRTDHKIDATKWDAFVTVWVDAGVSDSDTGPSADKYTTSRPHSQNGQQNSRLSTPADIAGTVIVSIGGQTAQAHVSVARGNEVHVKIPVISLSSISPWMPSGFGNQTLYTVSARFVPTGKIVSERPFEVPYPLEDHDIKGANGDLSIRVGFRRVELVQEPLPV